MNHSPNNDVSRRSELRSTICICLALATLIWITFSQAIHFGFVNFDDDVYVYKNPHVTNGVTVAGTKWAFTHVHSSNWHPLTWLSHMLDAQLYGLDAGGHHLTNILIHTFTTILLFLLLRQMTGFVWRSALVAAVFAVHPLRVESVVWIAERKDVLSAFFFVLTIAAYFWFTRRARSWPRYLLVLLVFSFALMSKPMVVTLPFVLLLLDYWPLAKFNNSKREIQYPNLQIESTQHATRNTFSLLLEKIPFLLLSLASCIITIRAQHQAVSPLTLPLRLENAAVSCVIYLWQMIYPAGLVVMYPFPENGLPHLTIIAACIVLAAISILAIAMRRKCPWLLFGWLWYLGMLVPVIGIMQVGAQAHADRYTYLPQIGLYIAVIWTVAEWFTRSRRQLLVPITVSTAIVSLLVICTRHQTSYWRNSDALWTRALAFTSGNIVAQNNLGNALLEEGKVDDAIAHFKAARRIKPEDAKAAFNLGNALIQKGDLNNGIANLQDALQLNPNYVEAHINLGGAFLKTDRAGDAIVHFQTALQLDPLQINAWNDLGYAHMQQGATDQAAACFQKALQIDPNQPVTLNNVANALVQRGQIDEAIGHYQKALQLKPNYPEAEYNLGTALAQKNNLSEAVIHFRKALQLKPDYASAAYNIGIAQFHQNRVTDADASFRKALEINPEYTEAHYNLGNTLVREQKIDDAIVEFRKALQIEPGQFLTRNNLGYLLLQRGKTDEAITEFQTVLQTQPENPDAHFNLGNAFMRKNRADSAASEFQKALAHEPNFAEAHYGLGTALLQQGRETDALAQFQQAVELKPDYSEALNDFAWELATAPEAAARDGAKAVELAQKADLLTGNKDLDILDTVAAAYAEAHRFEDATRTARQAIEFARTSGQIDRVAQLNSELQLYESGQPFHRNVGR